jgi:hypothetical protein
MKEQVKIGEFWYDILSFGKKVVLVKNVFQNPFFPPIRTFNKKQIQAWRLK